MEKLTT